MYLSVLMFIFLGMLYFLAKQEDAAGIFIVILLVMMVAPGFSALEHAENLGTVQGQQALIQVHQERITALQGHIKDLKDPSGTLLNADTPVASIIEQISLAESDLARVKLTKAKAERSIITRKIGPFNFVTWLF